MGTEKGFGLDGGYVIGGRSSKCALIFVPTELGWRAAGVRHALDRIVDALSADEPVTGCCPDVHRGNTWYEAEGGGDVDGEARRWEEWLESHPAKRVAGDVAGVASALREGGAAKVIVVGSGWHPGIAVALSEKAAAHPSPSDEQPAASAPSFVYARCSALETLLAFEGSRSCSAAADDAYQQSTAIAAAAAELRMLVLA